MSLDFFYGYPPPNIRNWMSGNKNSQDDEPSEPSGPSYTPYIYFGSVGADHEHKAELDSITSSSIECVNGDIIWTQTITYLSADEGCTCQNTGISLFAASQITTLDMPTLTSINQEAFTGSMLETVCLSNINMIGTYAFQYCLDLTSITFNYCDTVCRFAFANCESLLSISLNGTQSIEAYAFKNCTSLRYVDLPDIVSIETNAFENCPSDMTWDFSRNQIFGDPSMEQAIRIQFNLPDTAQLIFAG